MDPLEASRAVTPPAAARSSAPAEGTLRLPALERDGRIPIVFHPQYDIALHDIQGPHPFEFNKRSRVFSELRNRLVFSPESIFVPEPASDALLGLVHESNYLKSVAEPARVAAVMGLPELQSFPTESIERRLIDPLRYAVGGTVLASRLAAEHGWAINLSGGFHHAKSATAEGFCFFADTAVAIRALQMERPDLRVLSVDLDAHQGNGVAAILGEDPRVCLFDIHNGDIYPRDPGASERIDFNLPIRSEITDHEYLDLLMRQLPRALDTFSADLIVYSAGSDVCAGDRLGKMRLSDAAVYRRDEFVFAEAFKREIPIVMVLAGGYSRRSPNLIAGSIMHILRNQLGVGLFGRQPSGTTHLDGG
ncbi:MAG: hypothetical protein RL417_2499 [Pseudomonadota bacterium]|jgi:histone deacetylase 11